MSLKTLERQAVIPVPTRPRVLIVGLGVSGIATALRLHEIGWQPVIVERSDGRRTNGHFVDLFGAGKTAARRRGILEGLRDRASGGAHVELRTTATGTSVTERFELLVVGADGLRSAVRSLVFGPDRRYLRRLGHMLVAYEFPGVPKASPAGKGPR